MCAYVCVDCSMTRDRVTEIVLKPQLNINLAKTWMMGPGKRASRAKTSQHPGRKRLGSYMGKDMEKAISGRGEKGGHS